MKLGEAVMTDQIWNRIGKRTKLALAARDPHELRRIFGEPRNVSREISDNVLARCDKYAADMRSKQGSRYPWPGGAS